MFGRNKNEAAGEAIVLLNEAAALTETALKALDRGDDETCHRADEAAQRLVQQAGRLANRAGLRG